jgi:hypothetical protein
MAKKHRNSLIGLIGLCLLLIIIGPVYGQGSTGGSIAGTAKDTTGGVLPGVTITLTHTATGRVRTTITGDEGRYIAPSLELGTYAVAAELVGFQALVQSGIKLELGAQLVLDFVLSPGNISERVTVTGEAALVETTSSTIGGLVDDKKIRDLPLNGRDYVQLATLEAGVYRTRMPRAYDVHRGAGTQISINGARVDQNLFVQDGTTANDFFGMTPGGVSGDSLGVESIQEFRVLSHNFSAEYGQAGGAVIMSVSKSGSNEFHGNVFEFHRNSALDARNFFDRGEKPPGFKKNQFGFTLGGPIVTEKTFFFGSYEGLVQRLASTQTFTVPNADTHQGLLPVGEVANCTDPRPGGLCFVGIDANIQPFMDLYPLPSPGGRDNGDGTAQLFQDPTVPIDQNQFTIKIDHSFSDSDSMFGRYLYDNSETKLFSSANLGFVRESKVRRQMVTLQETHIFSPNLLSVLRFGFNRAWTGQFNGGPLGTDFDPSLSFVTGRPMGSLLNSVGLSTVGSSVASDLVRVNNSFEYGGDFTHTRGNHSIKFGMTWRRIQSNGENGIRAVGSHTFAGLEEFFRGDSDKLETILPGSDLVKGWRQNIIGIYFQDDIQIRPNLTLNLGLRYEFITVPTEVAGRMSNILDPFSPTAVSEQVDPYFNNPSLKNFGPRVGVAWDPFGNGNTSVRLGGGLFFDQFSSKVIFTSGWQGLPFYARINVLDPPFPGTGFEDLPLEDLLSAVEEGPIQRDFTNAYQIQYNLSIQQALNDSTTLQVGYVGSLGRHLSRIQQTNNRSYILCPCADDPLTPDFDESTAPAGAKYRPASATRPNQLTQIIGMKAFDTNSSYNSLQVTLSRRFTEGLQFQVAYAWSKNLSESPGQNGGSSGGVTTTMDPEDRKRNRSRSPFDVRQDLTMNYTYDLPFGDGFNGVAGVFLSGWQLGGIIHIADGSPHLLNLGRSFSFQPSFSGNHNGPDGNTDRPSLVPGTKVTIREDFDPATGYYDPSVFVVAPDGFWGDLEKNAGTTPGEATFDLSVVKMTTVGERTTVQFRAEFFNIFNRTNFGTPRGQVFRSSGPDNRFGQITSTFTTSRQIQFGLKIGF